MLYPTARWLAALVVLIALVGISPSITAAQSATPWPTEVLAAYREGGLREFRSAGMRLLGPAAITVAAYRFEADKAAAQAFPRLCGSIHEQMGGDLQTASAPNLGDETLALAGEAEGDDPETLFPVGLVCWRDGPVVFLGFSAGLAGEQLPALFDVARTMKEQTAQANAAATPAPDQEMRTGGVWDLLPRLQDMPEGFVLERETPIEAPAG